MSRWVGVLLLLFGLQTSASEQTGDFRMVFVGDVMLAEAPGELIRQGRNPFRHFHDLFKSADVNIANLECYVGHAKTKEKKPYTFKAHPRVLKSVSQYFQVVSLANNHSGDYGDVAFSGMLDLIERSGLKAVGGGKNIRLAHEPVFLDKEKRIALLAYDAFLPRSFEALDDRPGVAWADPDFIAQDIARAKSHYKADFVIVMPHWGWEYEPMASKDQVRLAHFMLDNGADMVVGGHPHVTQNIEIYKNKPIFYSLGNFVFNGFEDEDTNTGWALELVIGKAGQIGWQVHVAKLDKNGIPHRAGSLPPVRLPRP
ncbi:MAG: CapA family protein [Burkholderiales bacterium]|nr:CapA family protein [Burkholderiales bacterium]